jgi:hypothetical protein
LVPNPDTLFASTSRSSSGQSFADSPNLVLPTNDSGDLTFSQRCFFWAIALALGLLSALDSRFQVTGDGISYIEMGDAYFRHDWKMAINSYWSPLYAWLIVLPKHLFGLSLKHESSSIHVVNFLIFVLVLFSFEFFLNQLIRSASLFDREHFGAIQPWALRLIGYALFLYAVLYWLSTDIVTPDLGVEAVVLLAAGLVLSIRLNDARWSTFVKLGVLLGIGYYVKVVLFPLAFLFLLAAFFAAPDRPRAIVRVSVSLLIFLLIAAPYIFILSKATGRFTYGDAGRLTYANYVDGLPLAVHWEGHEPNYGKPVHPTRQVFEHPGVFEFAQPIGGSYPAWYNPTYWHEGVTPKLSLRGEMIRLHDHLHIFFDLFAQQGEFFVALFALFLINARFNIFLRRWLREFILWAPAILALVAYSLIHVENRFLPGFLLICWLSLFGALPLPDSAIARKVVWCVSVALALFVGVRVLSTAALQTGHLFGARPNVSWDVAQQLRQLGVRPGDKVASIGFTFDGYWAHLAGVTIVAEVPQGDAGVFWLADPVTQAKVFELFSKFGAKAVVSNRAPEYTEPAGWTRISGWTPDGPATYYLRAIPDPHSPQPIQ